MTSTSVSTVWEIWSAAMGSGFTSQVCLAVSPVSARPASALVASVCGAHPARPSAATPAALKAAPLSKLRREIPVMFSLHSLGD